MGDCVGSGEPSPALSQWTTPPESRRCLVAVACNERTIHRETAASLARIGWGARVSDAAAAHQFGAVDFRWYDGRVSVADLRNDACRDALAEGYSHLLFLDADMTWPDDVLARMLAHHARGLVGAMYYLKRWPHFPVALRDGAANGVGVMEYHYDLAAPGSELLRRVDLLGMGCTLIPVALLRRMTRPFFAYQQAGDGSWSITEDVAFCQQAKLVNCPIWIDPAIECGHIGVQEITRGWFDRGMVERQMLADKQGVA